MISIKRLMGAVITLLVWAVPVHAESSVWETFDDNAQDRWEFITDGVMGGVSEGGAVIGLIDGDTGVHLTGQVSTKNNGGFIQVRRMLPDGLPDDTNGLELEVRGNAQPYYVFIRTADMTRPWHYYNAVFEAGTTWQNILVPLDAFERSHAHLNDAIAPGEVISIGLFAYGQDYEANLMVRKISLF